MGWNYKWLVCLCLGAFTGFAESAGTLDTNYVTVAGTDIAPNIISVLPGNQVLAGGSFTNYGGTGRAGVVRLNAGGSIDTGFKMELPLNISDPVIVNGSVILPAATNRGLVSAILPRSDGKTVVAGKFTHLGSSKLATPRIALLNGDGSALSFPADVEKVGPGSLLGATANGFYVGGDGNWDNQTRLALLRLNADGSRDVGFTPPTLASLGFQSGNVVALHRGPADTIYAVVAAAVNLQPRLEVLRLTTSGSLDTTFADSGKASCGSSLSLFFAATPSGQLVIFNNAFTSVVYRGVTLQSSVARLTLDGSVDASFVPPPALGILGGGAVQPDNKVLLLNSSLGAVARLHENGSKDTGYFNPAKVPNNLLLFAPLKISVAEDGSSFVAGNSISPTFQPIYGVFHVFGDPNSAPAVATQPLAQTNTLGARTRFTVNAQGAAPLSYQWFRGNTPINGANGNELILPATSAADDADFYCVISNSLGSITTAKVHLTLLPASAGTVFQETDVPAGPDNGVSELVWDTKGGLLAAGRFTRWNSTNRLYIARLLPDSVELDSGFNPTAQSGNSGNPFNEVLSLGEKVFASGLSDYQIGGKRYGAVRFNGDGSIDPTFLPQSSSTALNSGFRSTLPAVGPDGKVVLWASYWNGENVEGSHIRLNADGTRDPSFALRRSFYGMNGGAVAALPDGRYLVAGKPNVVGTVAGGVMRLKADGTVDPTFDTRSVFNASEVFQIAVLQNGRILVAGRFSYRANTQSPELTLGVIRLLPDGGSDPEFNPVPQLSHIPDVQFGSVRRIAVQADGRIIAIANATGGNFPRSQVYRFWPNGTLDPEFVLSTNSARNNSFSVDALAVRTNDNAIFLGGSFTEFSRFARTNFVRVNGGPLRPTPAAPTITSQSLRVVAKAGSTATLSVEPGGDGPFQFQWRRNATIAFTNFVDISGATNATLTLPNVRLTPQDSGLFQCAVVNPGGAVLSALITLIVEPDPALPGTIDTSLVAATFQGILTGQYELADLNPDGTLVASLGNTVVRLFEDGTQDVNFVPPADLVPTGGGISVVRRQPDGRILVAGRLKDGALARLLPNGQYDPAFVRTNNYTGGFQDVPQSLALQKDGRILLGGTFDNFAGRAVTGLLRFHPDGRVDESFPLTGIDNIVSNPTRTLPGRVMAVRVLPDDRIYIGGGFSHVRGVVRYGVARLHADGSLDTSFIPPTNGSTSGGTSGSMLFYQLGPISPPGGIYIFGMFRPDLSKPEVTALRLLPDGSPDPGFNLVTDFQINTAAVQPDGKLVINGQFTQLHGVPGANLARVNVDGSTDATWQRGANTGGFGAQLLLLPDGKLLVGNRRYFTGLGPVTVAPEVRFEFAQNELKLAWPSGYKLQRATQLVPANWQDLAVPSPFIAPLTGPGEFFRAIKNP